MSTHQSQLQSRTRTRFRMAATKSSGNTIGEAIISANSSTISASPRKGFACAKVPKAKTRGIPRYEVAGKRVGCLAAFLVLSSILPVLVLLGSLYVDVKTELLDVVARSIFCVLVFLPLFFVVWLLIPARKANK
jgi:hypothetical protein